MMNMSAIHTLYSYKVVVADLSTDAPDNTDTCLHVFEGEAKGQNEVIKQVSELIDNSNYAVITIRIENEGEEL